MHANQSIEGSAATSASVADVVASWVAEKYTFSRNVSIVRSSSAILSVISSILLFRVIFKSHDRLSTTYNRLILGMVIADLTYSFPQCFFGALAPSELSYAVWNASGTIETCDAGGFLYYLGFFSTNLYMCSLNLYYVAKIKCNKTDDCIKRKLEPCLHGVPVLVGLAVGTTLLAMQGINATMDGLCASYPYNPPHCTGSERGDTPEGFTVPCLRGGKAWNLTQGLGATIMFITPVFISMSLFSIYRMVSSLEQRSARYGAGALNINSAEEARSDMTANAHAGGGGLSSLISVMKRLVSKNTGDDSNRDNSSSRAVMHRAVIYSVSWFLTYGWSLAGLIAYLAGAPFPSEYGFITSFFQPLQGLWTLLIYMQPNTCKARNKGSVSWFRAFYIAMWSGLTGKKIPNTTEKDAENAQPPHIENNNEMTSTQTSSNMKKSSELAETIPPKVAESGDNNKYCEGQNAETINEEEETKTKRELDD